jgi:predicted type IV restriction endonuclease
MLADMLGYRKYTEITTEFAIRGTFVDLAVKVDEKFRFLIEAKAVGVELKDSHVKQAIDYGANQGIEWIILTNAITWRVYKVLFQKPVEKSLVFELDITQANPRDHEVVECLGNLSREGFTQSSMAAFFEQQKAMGKFSIASILLSEPVLTAARRTLRRLYPSVRVDEEALRAVIQNDVLKRDVVDSEEARAAQDTVKKAMRAVARSKRATEGRASLDEALEESAVDQDGVTTAQPTQSATDVPKT